MSAKKNIMFGAMFCLAAAAAALSHLPDGKAPFKQDRDKGRIYSGDAVLDREKLTWNYGSKQLKFNLDGSFQILSNERVLANNWFSIATPHGQWQTNHGGKMKPGEYDGKQIEVRDIKIDGNEIIFSGLVPWQKKGEKVLSGPWTLTVSNIGKGRFSFRYSYEPPKGQKYGGRGIFLTLTNIRQADMGQYGIWIPKDKKRIAQIFKPLTLKLSGVMPEDDFSIETDNLRTLGSSLYFEFCFNPKKSASFIVDLGQSRVGKTERKPGGVDLMAVDDLEVPMRGRNLLPNPYFAAKAHFLFPYNVHYLEVIDNVEKFSTDAKFGRYALNAPGGYKFASVPVDTGDYVFSFYFKGSGSIGIVVRSAGGASGRFVKNFTFAGKSPNAWSRHEIAFHFPKDNALSVELRIPKGVIIDGLQLEKGKHATAFEAPRVEVGTIGEFFFERGKKIDLRFELSTLEKAISGQGELSIRNFFGKEVFRQGFKFDFGAEQYPQIAFDPGKLPDGIYIVKLDYGKTAPAQFFRFAVMPFLKNTHKTARVFSLEYVSHWSLAKCISERHLERMQRIGIGINGHANQMTQDVLDAYAKYKVIPFDLGFASRTNSEAMKKLFPELKDIPAGRTWFFVLDKEKPIWALKGLLPDYRLVGGWNEDYKKKFQSEIIRQVRKYPKRFAYEFGSEWAHEIKDDPHYIDLYIAFREAVKSVYPDALVYEAGDGNMDIQGGTAYYDQLLTRMEGRTVTDFASSHTYVKDIRDLYANFRAFVEMLRKHKGYEKCRMAFPEGMHFFPYNIPAWDMEQVCWMGEGWQGAVLSYDLGWSEKISAAYFARSWLVFLTEFERVWCATSSASNTRNNYMDDDLTPRAFQKIPNTLGILLGNPKRYLGDFTFAPDTRCLVWEDEKGRPLAAVWNEEPAVNSGYKDAPLAKFDYRGAEYLDLMGVKRKPAADGEFPVSPFPLFIRGKIGDCENFVKSLSHAVLNDPDKLPCRIGFELKSTEALKLSLINPLARTLTGKLNIFGREYNLAVPQLGEQTLEIKLAVPIRKGRMEKLTIPYECVIDGRTIKQNLELNCFAVPKFGGDWKKIPAIPLTNKVAKDKNFSAKDFSASYQLAWDAKKMYLRVKVTDDVFAPGSSRGYRWNYDVLQVYFDTRCSAMKKGGKTYDDDDYDYGLMPTADGKNCEVWRALSPDIQLTLGIGAPKNNTLAPEINAKFTRTEDGYIYEAKFPVDYLLPIRLTAGYNFAFGIYAGDKDKGKGADKGLSNATEPGSGCYNKPHLWPIGVLTE